MNGRRTKRNRQRVAIERRVEPYLAELRRQRRSMDWFERFTGFRETSYHDTRAKLKVDGRRLQSLINGKAYGIGELELVSLQALRERVQSGGGLLGRLKASVVTGEATPQL
jgi:hypothetical protein